MKMFVSLLAFLAGAALAFGYPVLAERLPATAIGTYPVYAAATGFMRVEAPLRAEDAPVAVYVDLASAGKPRFDGAQAVLTLTVSTAGKTVLAEPLTFEGAAVRDDTPQTPELIYRAKVGTIDPVEPSPYTFVTGRGDAEGVDLGRAELILERGPAKPHARIQPVGFAVMAIGAVAFLLSLRGRGGGPPPNPNSKPPPPRWGRAAGDRR